MYNVIYLLYDVESDAVNTVEVCLIDKNLRGRRQECHPKIYALV